VQRARRTGNVVLIEELEERAPEGPAGRGGGAPELARAEVGGAIGGVGRCGQDGEEDGLLHHDD
jgi:hypothetical protein